MRFLKRFFQRRPTVEDYKLVYLGVMEEMVAESDRIYRSLCELLSSEIVAVKLSGTGLFKARAHASVFMVYAFSQKARDPQTRLEEVNDMLKVASGVAIRELLSPGTRPSLSREAASEFASRYMIGIMKAIADEIDHGPSRPGEETQGFERLVEYYHEALAASVPTYSQDHRLRVDHLIRANVSGAISHMAQWIAET